MVKNCSNCKHRIKVAPKTGRVMSFCGKLYNTRIYVNDVAHPPCNYDSWEYKGKTKT
jgi:hypothetical protein